MVPNGGFKAAWRVRPGSRLHLQHLWCFLYLSFIIDWLTRSTNICMNQKFYEKISTFLRVLDCFFIKYCGGKSCDHPRAQIGGGGNLPYHTQKVMGQIAPPSTAWEWGKDASGGANPKNFATPSAPRKFPYIPHILPFYRIFLYKKSKIKHSVLEIFACC